MLASSERPAAQVNASRSAGVPTLGAGVIAWSKRASRAEAASLRF